MKLKIIYKITQLSKLLIVVSIVFCIIIFQSCKKENIIIEEKPVVSVKMKIHNLNNNDNEILDLKGRLLKSENINVSSEIAKEVKNDNINWDLAYKATQGNRKGIFVPLKNNTETDFKLLASLYINGNMEEFIIQKRSGINEKLFSGEINYFRINGERIKKDTYLNGINTSNYLINQVRLKDGSCETTNGVGKFSDYDSWFDSDCDSERFANNTSHTIWYKPENATTSIPLQPGEWTDNSIDGFSSGGQVYKVCDGYHTCGVNTSGSYDTDYSNPINAGYNAVYGGLKDSGWLNELHTTGDHGWDSLFSR